MEELERVIEFSNVGGVAGLRAGGSDAEVVRGSAGSVESAGSSPARAQTSPASRTGPSAAVADLPAVGEDLAMTLRMVDAAAEHVERLALARDAPVRPAARGAAGWRPLETAWEDGRSTAVGGSRPRRVADRGRDGAVSAMQTLWPSAAAMLE